MDGGRRVNVGSLKHRVELLRQVASKKPDKDGIRKVRYVSICKTMAAIRDVSGRQFFEAAAHQMEDVVTFTIRYREGLEAAGLRIVWGQAAYDAIYINHLGYRRDYMQIKARQVQAVR